MASVEQVGVLRSAEQAGVLRPAAVGERMVGAFASVVVEGSILADRDRMDLSFAG